jgi:CDP-glycerol glycerophosphotransferase (TagB/SpsB family)
MAIDIKIKSAIRTLLHYLRRLSLLVAKSISLCFPKNEKMVLISSWFGKRYADNSMYLFEFMLNSPEYVVIWFTRDKNIYDKLRVEKKPAVYSYSFRALYYHLRSKLFISTVQFHDFIYPLMANCILLDLDHGFPAKYVHFAEPGITKRAVDFEMLQRRWIDYYMTASSYFTMSIVSKCFKLPPEKIVFSNKPRVDVFFDNGLRKNKNSFICDCLEGKMKSIVWMPTQRSRGNIHIDEASLLDLEGIQTFCEEMGAIFFIKKHFYHKNEMSHLDNYSRIIDITNVPLDVQVLLYQADVLISDYSSCYIEYLTLDRPIILYIYDFDDFVVEDRGVCVKMEDNHVGYKVKTPKELLDSLEIIGRNNWNDYENEDGRKEAKLRYFDNKVEIGNSRKMISEKIIPALLNGSYFHKWQSDGFVIQ